MTPTPDSAASSSHSPTPAGQTASNSATDQPRRPSKLLVEAVNQLFTQFQVAYPNQYYKAYPDNDKELLAKQLWLRSMSGFAPDKILRAAQRAIERSDFIPSISQMIRFIENDHEAYGLPDPRAAYREACLATSPKSQYNWSHAGVYHAGRLTDWFFISTSDEKTAYPVFERNYRLICERVFNGDKLDMPIAAALPSEINTPMSADEKRDSMAALRDKLGL